MKNGDDELRRLRDEVLQLVRTSAEAEGRVVSSAWTGGQLLLTNSTFQWTIMYDVSGVNGEDVERFLKQDLIHLVRTASYNLTAIPDHPAYLV